MNQMNSKTVPSCELCEGTGFYGDNGPGIKGNDEWQECECVPEKFTAKAMGVTLPDDLNPAPFVTPLEIKYSEVSK